MSFLAAGLAAFNPWLMVILVFAIVPAGISEAYFESDQSYDLSRHHTPERRELDYLRYLGASDETAKEVKIFSLAGFLIDRFPPALRPVLRREQTPRAAAHAVGHDLRAGRRGRLLRRLCLHHRQGGRGRRSPSAA